MMIDIRPADIKVNVHRGRGNILAEGIKDFERYVQGYKPPACYATHVEIVRWVGAEKITTFSQTFPTAKNEQYRRADFEQLVAGFTPLSYIFRIKDYGKIVDPMFITRMEAKMDEIINTKSKGFWSWYPKGGYDVLQLPNYLVNSVLHKLGRKKHWAGLEIPGLHVCSDGGAEVLDAGFGLDPSPIFTKRPNSEVSPANFFDEPKIALVSF
jgi:hypothetical protein